MQTKQSSSHVHTKYFSNCSIWLTLLAAPGIANAASSTTNVPVNATVAQVCSITTSSSLSFNVYDPVNVNLTAPLNATGQISVACSKGATGMTIGLDNGAHVVGQQRQMLGTLNLAFLGYSISQPSTNAAGATCTFPGSTNWTNVGNGLLSLTNATTSTARLYNVCGSIPGGQNVASDTYTDVVIATINF
jgi:spore coat protein U-like protein